MDGYNASFDQQQMTVSEPLPPAYNQSVAVRGVDKEIRNKITSTEEPISESVKDYNPVANKYNIYDDIPRMKKTELPPVVLPSDPGLFESYLAPLVVILNSIPALRNVLLRHTYFNYGFKPNWWNRERMFDSNQLPMEYQRLLAMFSESSNRAFSSIYNLTLASNKLVTEDIENGSEYINFILKSVFQSFSKANSSLEPELKSLLEFTLSTNPTDPTSDTDYYVIPVSSSVIKPDLYDNISTIFWGENFENFTSFKLNSLCDVMTFSIDSSGQAIDNGLNLKNTFYPQIYSKEHAYIIGEKYDKINDLSSQYEANLEAIQDTMIFQGKKISSILGMASGYLRSVGASMGSEANGFSEGDKILAAGQTVESINEHITKRRDDLKETNETFPDRINTLKELMADPEEIIKEHDLEPWLLSGVVLGPTEYYYKNSESEWTHVSVDQETCRDYKVENISFETLQSDVKGATCVDFDTLVLLTYVRQSVWEKREVDELSPALKDFVEADNENLQQVLNAYEGQAIIPEIE